MKEDLACPLYDIDPRHLEHTAIDELCFEFCLYEDCIIPDWLEPLSLEEDSGSELGDRSPVADDLPF